MIPGYNNNFAVVAIRCNSAHSTGKRKLIPGLIYYFIEEFKGREGLPEIPKHLPASMNLYDDYMNNSSSSNNHFQTQPHITISAIVGCNGSGKSSVIEFMMRLLNNFAAATFGEEKMSPASGHLHYIQGIKGDLWFYSEESLFRLNITDESVELYREFPVRETIYKTTGEDIPERPIVRPPIADKKELKRIFRNFFYTLISNYSIYAYNTNDFRDEVDSEEKADKLREMYQDEVFNFDTLCWLHGLFHRNDGYQIPMVITPFRNQGEIRINREIELCRERLIALMINHIDYRIINDHLKATDLSLEYSRSNNYYIKAISELKGMGKFNIKEDYDRIRGSVVRKWSAIIGINLTYQHFNEKYKYEQAIDYLTYKTLKIASVYERHNKYYTDLINSIPGQIDLNAIEKIIDSEAKDFSHITRKIYRTIGYIIFDVYNFGIDLKTENGKFSFEEISHRWTENVISKLSRENPFPGDQFITTIAIQSIIPPPFFQVNINLTESENNEPVKFESLSSGEKQLIYAVSTIVYYLDNINSVKYDYSDYGRVTYKNVLLIMEEVELYFHPEYQQSFIKYLLDGIMRASLTDIKGVHIMIVTHSPYVLSDIPRKHVLALEGNGEQSTRHLKAFSGNIHDMLRNSFFLKKGTQGLFAQWETGHISAILKIHELINETQKSIETDIQKSSSISQLHRAPEELYREELKIRPIEESIEELMQYYEGCENPISGIFNFVNKYKVYDNPQTSDFRFDYEKFRKDYSSEYLHSLITIIDEPIVRQMLLSELGRVLHSNEKQMKEAEIRELEERLQQLKGEL